MEGFATTAKSKPHLIDSLALAFEQQTLRYDPQVWPWMDDEVRAYERDDARLVQDAVIALALAELQAGKARQAARPRGRGRVHRLVYFD